MTRIKLKSLNKQYVIIIGGILLMFGVGYLLTQMVLYRLGPVTIDDREPLYQQETQCFPVEMQGHIRYTNSDEFIQVLGSYSHLAKSKNIYPSVMIAQAILESGLDGSSDLAKQSKNLFGIKGSYKGEGQDWYTLEDEGSGNYYEIQDEFRHYNSYYESISDYLLQLTEDERYQDVTRATSPEVQIRKIKEAGYATDAYYTTKIIDVINSYNLKQFD